jgi:GTP:adenosylcobinamide-phosphate guanylyltransferase
MIYASKPEKLENVNTPEELEEALELLKKS